MGTPAIGKVGIWSLELRFGDRPQALEAIGELDELGFGAVWVPGGVDAGVLADIEQLLAASKNTVIATGILNIWRHEPADVAAWWKERSEAERARLLIGIGVSHAPIIGEAWGKPIEATTAFLEAIEAGGMAMENTCVAALGPKMLALARDRTAGAHPYLVTPEHTAVAREILGPGKLLAPEQGVVLESDPDKARALARGALEFYTRMPNYRNNWKRLGFEDAEIDAVGDRLLDALFAMGSVEATVERVQAHLDAGADHVCLQVIADRSAGLDPLRAQWRALAEALL
jgi:probable F420-dependent oxidoreductase